jgi:chlorite dismutase
MSEDPIRSLNHFAGFSFRASFWEQDPQERTMWLGEFESNLSNLIGTFYLYQIYPSSVEADFLIWSAAELESDGTTRDFMKGFAKASNKARRFLDPQLALWGFTAQSTYSRARSAQEIDPFDGQRSTYLAIYPFVKTEDWYLLSRDARQGMMNEHIRLGKQYPSIHQLLLYSFGIQDQEFVVVYEMEDLPLFSKLVQELRRTDARVYTRRDTPLYTGVLQPEDDPLAMWRSV